MESEQDVETAAMFLFEEIAQLAQDISDNVHTNVNWVEVCSHVTSSAGSGNEAESDTQFRRNAALSETFFAVRELACELIGAEFWTSGAGWSFLEEIRPDLTKKNAAFKARVLSELTLEDKVKLLNKLFSEKNIRETFWRRYVVVSVFDLIVCFALREQLPELQSKVERLAQQCHETQENPPIRGHAEYSLHDATRRVLVELFTTKRTDVDASNMAELGIGRKRNDPFVFLMNNILFAGIWCRIEDKLNSVSGWRQFGENDIISSVFRHFAESTSFLKSTGVVYTPRRVIRYMYDRIGVDYGSDPSSVFACEPQEGFGYVPPPLDDQYFRTVLDPAVGSGGFLSMWVHQLITAVKCQPWYNNQVMEAKFLGWGVLFKAVYIRRTLRHLLKEVCGIDKDFFAASVANVNFLLHLLPLFMDLTALKAAVDALVWPPSVVKNQKGLNDAAHEYMTEWRNFDTTLPKPNIFCLDSLSLYVGRNFKTPAEDQLQLMRQVPSENDEEPVQERRSDDDRSNRVLKYARFDYVVANPPYVSVAHDARSGGMAFASNVDWDLLHQHIKSQRLQDYFFELGLSKLRDNGKLCFIVPVAFLSASGREKNVREVLLQNSVLSVSWMPKSIFRGSGVHVDTAVFVVQKTKPKTGHMLDVHFAGDSDNTLVTLKKCSLAQTNLSSLSAWRITEADFEDLAASIKRKLDHADGFSKQCFVRLSASYVQAPGENLCLSINAGGEELKLDRHRLGWESQPSIAATTGPIVLKLQSPCAPMISASLIWAGLAEGAGREVASVSGMQVVNESSPCAIEWMSFMSCVVRVVAYTSDKSQIENDVVLTLHGLGDLMMSRRFDLERAHCRVWEAQTRLLSVLNSQDIFVEFGNTSNDLFADVAVLDSLRAASVLLMKCFIRCKHSERKKVTLETPRRRLGTLTKYCDRGVETGAVKKFCVPWDVGNALRDAGLSVVPVLDSDSICPFLALEPESFIINATKTRPLRAFLKNQQLRAHFEKTLKEEASDWGKFERENGTKFVGQWQKLERDDFLQPPRILMNYGGNESVLKSGCRVMKFALDWNSTNAVKDNQCVIALKEASLTKYVVALMNSHVGQYFFVQLHHQGAEEKEKVKVRETQLKRFVVVHVDYTIRAQMESLVDELIRVKRSLLALIGDTLKTSDRLRLMSTWSPTSICPISKLMEPVAEKYRHRAAAIIRTEFALLRTMDRLAYKIFGCSEQEEALIDQFCHVETFLFEHNQVFVVVEDADVEVVMESAWCRMSEVLKRIQLLRPSILELYNSVGRRRIDVAHTLWDEFGQDLYRSRAVRVVSALCGSPELKKLKPSVEISGAKSTGLTSPRIDNNSENFRKLVSKVRSLPSFWSVPEEEGNDVAESIAARVATLDEGQCTVLQETGDGHCAFRGAARQLLDDSEMHAEVRQNAVNELQKSAEYFKMHYPRDDVEQTCAAQLRILDALKQGTKLCVDDLYASHMLLEAVARAYDCVIQLIEARVGEAVTVLNEAGSRALIRLLYWDGLHFDSIVRVTAPAQGNALSAHTKDASAKATKKATRRKQKVRDREDAQSNVEDDAPRDTGKKDEKNAGKKKKKK